MAGSSRVRVVEGFVWAVCSPRKCGGSFRVPVKVGSSWVNVRGSLESINERIKGLTIGERIRVRCRVSKKGEREALWATRIERLEGKGRVCEVNREILEEIKAQNGQVMAKLEEIWELLIKKLAGMPPAKLRGNTGHKENGTD